MGIFNKDKLRPFLTLPGGTKIFHYTDTGIVGGDFTEGSTFFTTGYDCGMRRGDVIFISEGDTGTYSDLPYNKGGNRGGRRLYHTTVYEAVDTGATQITLNAVTLIGDTS